MSNFAPLFQAYASVGIGDGRLPSKALSLISDAAEAPAPIPEDLRKKAAKVKTEEEAQAVVEEFRKLRAGATLDHSDLFRIAEDADKAEARALLPQYKAQLMEKLRESWAKLVEALNKVSVAQLRTEGSDLLRLPAPVQKDLIDVNEVFAEFRNLARFAVNQAGIAYRGDLQGEGWSYLALLTDIPGEGPDDYETAHSLNVNPFDPASLREFAEKAEGLGIGLEVRAPEEIQASLDGWNRDKAWFVHEHGRLYKRNALGSHSVGPVASPGKIRERHARALAEQWEV
ncbi:hypothetical protein DMP23_04980 [Amycolatopsis sp. A1MSW2902]|uniref:hypothetical protein n=1 Tax=Amycolatopsis sp. A1MSW2902 TaxID=687413 RepID=UPI00307D77EA